MASSEMISIGNRLSQEEIEDTFDTGFGYQISGINPRRDDSGERYILLFANEDGPYEDSVKEGRFEYIGEGLHGDQSESSSGNSALIDAISSDIPVHFFYKESESEGWEYQGLLDVLRYTDEEREGRRVLVFTMEHQRQLDTDTDPSGLYLVPVNEQWREKFRRTVETPVDLTQYENLHPQLADFEERRVWATTETNSAKKQAAIEQMNAGDHLLSYHGGDFIAGGSIDRVFESAEVGELVWDGSIESAEGSGIHGLRASSRL